MMSILEKNLNTPNHGSLAYLRRFIMRNNNYKNRSSDGLDDMLFGPFDVSWKDTNLMLEVSDDEKLSNFYKYCINKYPNNTTKIFMEKEINHEDFIEKFPNGVKKFQVKIIVNLKYTEDPQYAEKSGSGYSVLAGWYVASHVSDKHFDSYCGSGSNPSYVDVAYYNETTIQECIFYFETYEEMMIAERDIISGFRQVLHGHTNKNPAYGDCETALMEYNGETYHWLLNVANGGQGRRPQKPFSNGLLWYCLNRFTKEVRFYDSMPYFGVRNCDWELKELKSWEAADREILAHLRKSLSLNLLNIRPHFAEILERMF